MSVPTITIGIPALNEGSNVRHLLVSLQNQQLESAQIVKFIVISDGSTDDTVSQTQQVQDQRLQIISHPIRQGLAATQNHIISLTTSDILVLLNADIVIKDPDFIRSLVSPILSQAADFTSPRIQELPPQSFFEQVLHISMHYKTVLFEFWNQGDNVFTCHGPARAFSHAVYTSLNFPASEGEDIYSYLFSQSQGFRYAYIKTTQVFYRLPRTFTDHFKQSIRFLSSRTQIIDQLGKNIAPHKYSIPFSVYFFASIKCLPIFFRYPLHTCIYFVILSVIKISQIFGLTPNETFLTSSSKNLVTS